MDATAAALELSPPPLPFEPEADTRPAFALVARSLTPTNASLLRAFRRLGPSARLVDPDELGRGEVEPAVALARLDVRPTLDGIEPGLFALRRREQDGLPLLNPPAALAACHDKLATARRLADGRVPHPATALVDGEGPPPELEPPFVVKPRFGSWGRDVSLCRDRRELAARLREIAGTPWFSRHGALVQEYVPSEGRDLRLVVAGGSVIGAAERRAAPGEWRTNVCLGGTRVRVAPPPEAVAIALAAAGAVGGDLVGVDLLPTGSGYVVLELNGAVDFTDDYSLDGTDVFDLAAVRLASVRA